MLCCIVMFIEVYVSLRRYQGLHHITTLIHGLLQRLVGICNHNQRCDTLIMWYWVFNKCYVALWRLSQVMLHYRHSWRVMSHCDICQGLCHIVIMPKMSQCDILCILMFKKFILEFSLYIYSPLTKEMV